MNIRKKNDTVFDKDQILSVAAELILPESFVELLFLRGLDSADKIKNYLNPNGSFNDPFLFKTMQMVVDRISAARDNGERVVVYCDYDADGICAGAILSLFLSSLGIEVSTFVPSRSGDGYGLHIEPLDRIIEECCPDLIITCDCGISCHAEVEHVLDLGVDIIVTDHHEVPDKIPNCVVLNPHVADCGYPFANLCGAGVALKVVQAFLGEEAAEEYLDMAAVATIADLVPLIGENRLIVQRGLKQLKKRTNLGFSRLLDRLEMDDMTSTNVAFKIAPRINAAGRMGDATRAFKLLTSADIAEIDAILEEIEADNSLRKDVCDNLYEEAVADLCFEDLANRRSIVLSYPDREKGITGIVAARLAGEFKRPTFIMVRSGDHYKGAARGIEGVNIHKILVYAQHLFIEYGGHEQAAGFSISEDNIPEFKRLVEEYLVESDSSLYLPSFSYDLEVTESQLSREFVKALDLMEPFGHGNHRPLFLLRTTVGNIIPCKNSPAHTQVVTGGGLSLIAFNFAKRNRVLLGGDTKKLVIEAQISTFGGGGVRGVLRQVSSDSLFVHDELACANFLRISFLQGCGAGAKEIYGSGDGAQISTNLPKENAVIAADLTNDDTGINIGDDIANKIGVANEKGSSVSEGSPTKCHKSKTRQAIKYREEELSGLIGDNIFGTLIIAGCKQSYEKFMQTHGDKTVLQEFIYSTTKNNYTRVIISPNFDEGLPLSLYKRIILLDAPLSNGLTEYLLSRTKAEIFLPEKSCTTPFLEGLTLTREVFGQYYEALKKCPSFAPTLFGIYQCLPSALKDLRCFTACLMVFCELGLMETTLSGGVTLTISKDKRANLGDSSILQALAKMTDGVNI